MMQGRAGQVSMMQDDEIHALTGIIFERESQMVIYIEKGMALIDELAL
jgi:hypothetical protein